MPLQPIELPKFGGLDLSGDPQEEAFIGAIDLMDIMLDWPGLLRARDGARYGNTPIPASGTALAMKYTTISPFGTGTETVFLTNKVTDLVFGGDVSGTLRTIPLGTSSSAAWFAEIGTPTQTYLAYTSTAATATYANTATT